MNTIMQVRSARRWIKIFSNEWKYVIIWVN
jgi:hypothetical protein